MASMHTCTKAGPCANDAVVGRELLNDVFWIGMLQVLCLAIAVLTDYYTVVSSARVRARISSVPVLLHGAAPDKGREDKEVSPVDGIDECSVGDESDP